MAEEQFLFDTGYGVIFDIKGTVDNPLSISGKEEIKERLQKFSETPEAREQFKTLRKLGQDGKSGIIRLTFDPTIRKDGAGGISYGNGIVELATIEDISYDTLFHELEHECQGIDYPGLWNPKNYDNAYDYFKNMYIHEAEAKLKGLWFEVHYSPKEGLGDGKEMLEIKECLSETITEPESLKKAVFKEYFNKCMRHKHWEQSYTVVYNKCAKRGYFWKATPKLLSYPDVTLSELGLGNEDLEFSRMAINPAKTFCDALVPKLRNWWSPWQIRKTRQGIQEHYDRIEHLCSKQVQKTFFKSLSKEESNLTEEEKEARETCKKYLDKVVIPEGMDLKRLGKRLFESNFVLKEVVLSDSVTEIDERAFFMCSNLTEFSAPKLETIGDDAFWGCDNLKKLTLPATVTQIGKDAFKGCNNLTITCANEKVAKLVKESGFTGKIKVRPPTPKIKERWRIEKKKIERKKRKCFSKIIGGKER